MQILTKACLVLAAAGALLASAATSHATLIPIAQFTGNLSESWESFTVTSESNNYTYLAEGAAIMGGAATISSTKDDMVIFDYSVDNGYYLGGGRTQPSDGTHGMGLGTQRGDVATINFLNPITDFGAFWANSAINIPLTLTFSDGSVESFFFSAQNSGVMDWHGWHSTVGINSISWTSEFIAVDGLQANSAPASEVPDGGATLPLLGFAMSGAAWLRRLRLGQA